MLNNYITSYYVVQILLGSVQPSIEEHERADYLL